MIRTVVIEVPRYQAEYANCHRRTSGKPPAWFAPRATFDLVYAISVFTHLPEDMQFLWLQELRRIVRPRGLVLASLHGQASVDQLSSELAAKLERQGFLHDQAPVWRGTFPDWYQTAYHTREYVLDRFGRYFEVLDFIPRGLNNDQTMIILRRI